jgi:hypothetical protein
LTTDVILLIIVYTTIHKLTDAQHTDEQKAGFGMYFEILGEIEHIETIAVSGRIRDIMRLRMATPNGENSKGTPKFAFKVEESAMLRFTGMKPMA